MRNRRARSKDSEEKLETEKERKVHFEKKKKKMFQGREMGVINDAKIKAL